MAEDAGIVDQRRMRRVDGLARVSRATRRSSTNMRLG